VRKTFSLALAHRLAESTRRGDSLSLVLARIDNFESLADRHGLQQCNELLEAVGKFFIASVRGMDWVARFDAATFAFLLPNTPHAGALRVAERLRTTTAAAGPTVGGAQVGLTLSLGTTVFMVDDTSEAILRRAEDAMNASVRAGGNCIRSYVVGQFEAVGVA
jgi:diguanylate cyclase